MCIRRMVDGIKTAHLHFAWVAVLNLINLPMGQINLLSGELGLAGDGLQQQEFTVQNFVDLPVISND